MYVILPEMRKRNAFQHITMWITFLHKRNDCYDNLPYSKEIFRGQRVIKKPNMIVINIALFIRNRGKIREQLAGVAFYNSFSNNNEI